MTTKKIATDAECFDEWMRRFIVNPSDFQREFETVGAFLSARMEGKPPTYGETCVAYLAKLRADLSS